MTQGGHDFQKELVGTYDGLGYYMSRADPCIHSRGMNGVFDLNGTYTDDVLGASTNDETAEAAADELGKCFDIKKSKPSYIVGIGVNYDKENGVLELSQRTFFLNSLK
ncbi:hypothetical protein CVT26_000820 [Gymnopilus dilepis]|uniref:Uncharacterized protein n=1 Tax=Gymnopilus dilepis TaxID=231916 RepID=A0A409YLE2_9AGAR|nr:hypothetical protein CVT26_000820 [Gymnopilus dilepis]